MDVVVTGRGGGKTLRLVRWLIEHPNAVVFVADQYQARYLHEECFIPKMQIITRAIDLAGRDPDTEIAIDNLDLFLSWITGGRGRVSFVTMTGDFVDTNDHRD